MLRLRLKIPILWAGKLFFLSFHRLKDLNKSLKPPILVTSNTWVSVSIAIIRFVDTSIPTFSRQKPKSAWFLQEKKQTALTKPLTLTFSSPKTTYNPNLSQRNRHLGFCSLALLSVHPENHPISCPLGKLWRHFEVSVLYPIPPILTAKVSGIAILENCRYRPPLVMGLWKLTKLLPFCTLTRISPKVQISWYIPNNKKKLHMHWLSYMWIFNAFE